jgi:hypothetical protein
MNAEIIRRLEQSFRREDEAGRARLITAGVKDQLEQFLKTDAQYAARDITKWLNDRTMRGPIEQFLKRIARYTADDIYRLLREREKERP